jgi:hypothetical protein
MEGMNACMVRDSFDLLVHARTRVDGRGGICRHPGAVAKVQSVKQSRARRGNLFAVHVRVLQRAAG